MPLSEAPEGRRVTLVNLPADGPLRDRLRAMGIRPGATLEVLRRGSPGGILHLSCGVLEFMLRRDQAAQMAVSCRD
ncbi:MAG: iron transporter [Cyanobium sp. CACIAM 14]|nr:MAG: iron transporter [Cyanobium sp. CACIAM 14]